MVITSIFRWIFFLVGTFKSAFTVKIFKILYIIFKIINILNDKSAKGQHHKTP